MSEWTHRICEACYMVKQEENGGYRLPLRYVDAPIEHCCYCGAISYSGIYVREDPKNMKCMGEIGRCHDHPTPMERVVGEALAALRKGEGDAAV